MSFVPLIKQLIARTQKPEKIVSIRKAELKNTINFVKFDRLKTFTKALLLFVYWKLKPLLRLWLHTYLKNLVKLRIYRAVP